VILQTRERKRDVEVVLLTLRRWECLCSWRVIWGQMCAMWIGESI